jgi:hypothetical protein
MTITDKSNRRCIRNMQVSAKTKTLSLLNYVHTVHTYSEDVHLPP